MYHRQDLSTVTVQVFYFMPDHQSLIQCFCYQTLDLRPRYPRIHRFLDHWHREIEAVIQEVIICDSLDSPKTLRNGIIFRA